VHQQPVPTLRRSSSSAAAGSSEQQAIPGGAQRAGLKQSLAAAKGIGGDGGTGKGMHALNCKKKGGGR